MNQQSEMQTSWNHTSGCKIFAMCGKFCCLREKNEGGKKNDENGSSNIAERYKMGSWTVFCVRLNLLLVYLNRSMESTESKLKRKSYLKLAEGARTEHRM